MDCKLVPYYQTIYDKCKSYSTNCSVLLNPGVMTNECYVNVSDILLTAEYDWKAYSANQGAQPSYFAVRLAIHVQELIDCLRA